MSSAQQQVVAPDAAVAPYIDDRELARRTPIGRGRWQELRWKGGGPPFYKVGKRCLYKWDEVCAWIDSQRVTEAVATRSRR